METFSKDSFIVNEHGEHKGGKMVCSVCGNASGVRWTNNNRGNDVNKWTSRVTCKCGSTVRFYRRSGEIVEQKLAKAKIDSGQYILTDLN